MPMPTRRAVRPDSKHYRDSRRQRLTRSLGPGGGKRGLWTALAAIFAIGLIAAGMTMLGSHQRHLWAWVVLLVSIAGILISIGAAMIAPK